MGNVMPRPSPEGIKRWKSSRWCPWCGSMMEYVDKDIYMDYPYVMVDWICCSDKCGGEIREEYVFKVFGWREDPKNSIVWEDEEDR